MRRAPMSRGTTEYGAVIALESYFHDKQFRYDQTPPTGPGPVLADFMLHSHRGYCQMFSGSMALVLRMHGIPARVADGFTEGSPTTGGTTRSTDRDAHAGSRSTSRTTAGSRSSRPRPARCRSVQASTATRRQLGEVDRTTSENGRPVRLQQRRG